MIITFPIISFVFSLKGLNLSLDTEKEEKRLLANQLSELEKKYNGETEKLQHEKDSMKEKLKKKQESLSQISEEKEKIYTELSYANYLYFYHNKNLSLFFFK